jgi:hypothetical protein
MKRESRTLLLCDISIAAVAGVGEKFSIAPDKAHELVLARSENNYEQRKLGLLSCSPPVVWLRAE